jgi:hypothetical protein
MVYGFPFSSTYNDFLNLVNNIDNHKYKICLHKNLLVWKKPLLKQAYTL